jgi:hypothetical protein
MASHTLTETVVAPLEVETFKAQLKLSQQNLGLENQRTLLWPQPHD